MRPRPPPARRFLPPEVIQLSPADSAAAALRCALGGFGLPVDEARLREACPPGAGTALDRVEWAAQQVGFEAEQALIPVDQLLADGAEGQPALVELREEGRPGRIAVLWRQALGRYLLMDPLRGRRWLHADELSREIQPAGRLVAAEDWRAEASAENAVAGLRARLRRLGVEKDAAQALISAALAAPGWRALAALDAALRVVSGMIDRGGLRRGRQVTRTLAALAQSAQPGPDAAGQPIPAAFWSVQPAPTGESGPERLQVRGVALVRLRGARPATAERPATPAPKPPRANTPRRIFRERVLQAGFWLLAAVLGGVILGAGTVVIEAILFRAAFGLGNLLGLPRQRAGALTAVLIFLCALLMIEVPLAAIIKRLGRRLDLGLRVSFLEKLARLEDGYFRSRSTADLAHRSHDMHRLRAVYELWARLLRAWVEIAATAAGIIWIAPASAPLALLAAASSVLIPLSIQPALARQDLRARTYQGTLGRFYLDALTGLIAARAHVAELALRREHERLVTEWVRASRSMHRAYTAAEALQLFLGFGFAGWLLIAHLASNGSSGAVLALIYWALALPALGQECVSLARLSPPQQNAALRLMEPLSMPDERDPAATGDSGAAPTGPVGISLRGVRVRAGGQTILEDIHLTVAPGEHLAIVGPSGAGKSTLMGLLLGWQRAAEGAVEVDGVPLEGSALERLRQRTAWVEPEVQLWNRTLLDNLRFGAEGAAHASLGAVLRQADLLALVENLPEGLQTRLGEGGGLVSGGEGQRVRLGRALLRPNVRLVILDEPFRGLDRAQRQALLARAREHWKGVTLLCVTHDVADTADFPRVLVLEGGRIVEDEAPETLAAREGSRYRAMREADRAVRETLWRAAGWRWLRLTQGRLDERREPPG